MADLDAVAGQAVQGFGNALNGLVGQEVAHEGPTEARFLELVELGEFEAATLLLHEFVEAEISTDIEQMIQMMGPEEARNFTKFLSESTKDTFDQFLQTEVGRATDIRQADLAYLNTVLNPLWAQQGQIALGAYQSHAAGLNLLAQLAPIVQAAAAMGIIPEEVGELAETWVDNAMEFAEEVREQTDLVDDRTRNLSAHFENGTIDPTAIAAEAEGLYSNGIDNVEEFAQQLAGIIDQRIAEGIEFRREVIAPGSTTTGQPDALTADGF